jgi:hypothetical protein
MCLIMLIHKVLCTLGFHTPTYVQMGGGDDPHKQTTCMFQQVREYNIFFLVILLEMLGLKSVIQWVVEKKNVGSKFSRTSKNIDSNFKTWCTKPRLTCDLYASKRVVIEKKSTNIKEHMQEIEQIK